MCLSIISTVIICWLTLLHVPLQRRRCPCRRVSLVRSLRLCSASATVTCCGWPLPYRHIQRGSLNSLLLLPLPALVSATAPSLSECGQIYEAGWAYCFQPQSTASLAHDQARSQPCTDKGSCYISCYITPYVTWYKHTWEDFVHWSNAHQDQKGSNRPLVCPCNHHSPIVELWTSSDAPNACWAPDCSGECCSVAGQYT